MELNYGESVFESMQSFAFCSDSDDVFELMNALQEAASSGDVKTVTWILDQHAIEVYYEDAKVELEYELCSVASCAIKRGQTKVIELLISRYPELRREFLLESIVGMPRAIKPGVTTKSMKWLKRRVDTETMMDIWTLARDHRQEYAMHWFALQRLF